MFKLSTHITEGYFEASDVAEKLHIKNIMHNEQCSNAVLLCNTLLEPIITKIGMSIDSGFRCPQLNTAVDGSVNPLSQHCEGKAADILPIKMPLNIFFNKIVDLNLPFDQLILEFSWVHISYNGKNNRHQIFQAYHDLKGNTLYKTIKKA